MISCNITSPTQISNHQDNNFNSKSYLGQLSPKDRVKLSLERLDLPDWYKGRISKPELAGSIYKMPLWKKGSFANVQNISSSSLPNPTSSSNPLSPSPILSKPPIKQPYTGWRSAQKQPSFLPIKIGSAMGH